MLLKVAKRGENGSCYWLCDLTVRWPCRRYRESRLDRKDPALSQPPPSMACRSRTPNRSSHHISIRLTLDPRSSTSTATSYSTSARVADDFDNGYLAGKGELTCEAVASATSAPVCIDKGWHLPDLALRKNVRQRQSMANSANLYFCQILVSHSRHDFVGQCPAKCRVCCQSTIGRK